MKKRMIPWMVLFAMLLALCLPVQAAQTGKFLQEAGVNGDRLEIHCAPMPGDGAFQVTLGGQKLDVESSTQAQVQEPVTVYCLVDASGSIDGDQLELVRQILHSLNESLDGQSNMVLGLLEDTLSESELLQTREQRTEAIDALAPTWGNTNLYGGIVSALERLNVSSQFHSRRCLVVFSDGDDYSAEGSARTVQEVLDAISGSAMPIYTVSVAYQTQSEASRHFGSFARASVGGIHFTPLQNQQAPETVSDEIWDSLERSVILTADASGLHIDDRQDQVLLRVIYTTQDAQYEDTLELYTEDLPQPTQEPTEATQPTEQAPEPTQPEPQPSWLETWFLPGIAAVVVLVVVVVLLVVRGKKKPKPQEPANPTRVVPTPAQPTMPTKLRQEPTVPTPPRPAAPVRKLRVQMVLLRHSGTGCSFELEERKISVIGRSGADIVPDPKDAMLSARHCSIQWDGVQVSVQDIGSTNGTYINGVPIRGKGWMPLEDGGRLRVGSGEYRMVFDGPGR